MLGGKLTLEIHAFEESIQRCTIYKGYIIGDVQYTSITHWRGQKSVRIVESGKILNMNKKIW